MKYKSLSLIALMLFLTVCRVYGASLIPAKIQHLPLGSTLAEIQHEFPDAKAAYQGDKHEKEIIFVSFSSDEMWDSAMFELMDGRVISISLLRGVVPRDEHGDREVIIKEALRIYGHLFSKRVALTSENRPEPIFVWKAEERNIYLSVESPQNQGAGGRNHIRLVIAPSNREIGELFQLPTPAQMEAAAFNWLLGDLLKRIDGN